MENYKLEQLCDVKSSKRIFAKDYVEKGIPFYRGKEITELSNNEKLTDRLFISFEKYNEIKEKFEVPKTGDILITAVGTIGNLYMVEDESLYFKDGNIIWFNNYNLDRIIPEYLFIILNTKRFKKILENKGKIGSVQNALTIEKVKKIEIPIPSLEVQRKIIDKISSFNKKIKSNVNIINNLEESSQLLFYKWFVNFNFPNENGQPYKDSGGKMIEVDGKMIPYGWSKKTLQNFITNLSNGDWGEDLPFGDAIESYCIRGADIPDVKYGKTLGIPLRYIKSSKDNLKSLNHGNIVIEASGGSPTQSTGRTVLIRASLLKSSDRPFYFSNFSKVIVPKDNYSMFLFLLLNNLYQRNVFFHFEGKTSGIRNLLLNNMIKKIEFVNPNIEVLKEFEKHLGLIWDKIFNLGHESELLGEMRDLLIKKLIE